MGRKTEVLLRGFRAAKCLTLLKLATARIKVLRNKRSVSAKQMRMEIAQLLSTGQDAQVYISKADALIKQQNMVAVYDLIDQYCHAVISRFPMIEIQRNCPPDVRDAIASLIYAAPRCVELSELAGIKEAFLAKYGKEFIAAAAELRPDCGVNPQVIELLTTRPASGQVKLKLMKEICAEHNVKWTPGEALGESVRNQHMVPPSQRVETKVEPVKADGRASFLSAGAGPSRISEAGPLSSSGLDGRAHFQGEVGAVHKVGLTAVESLQKSSGATLAMVVPELKPGISSQGAAGDGATFSAVPAELFETQPATVPVVTGEGTSASDSFGGVIDMSSGVDIGAPDKGEGEASHWQPADDDQDGLTDSDESFVFVEEERLEDEVNSILETAALRKQSFAKELVEASTEADFSGPSLSNKSFRETGENSVTTEILYDEDYAGVNSKGSILSMQSSLKDTAVKVSIETDSKNKVDELMQSKWKELAGGSSLGSRTESLKMEQYNGHNHNVSEGSVDRKLEKPIEQDLPDENEGKSVLQEMEKQSEDDAWEKRAREKMEKLVEHDPPYEIPEENMSLPEITREEINQNVRMGTLIEENFEASQNRIALPEVLPLEMLKIESFSEKLGADSKSNLEQASQSVAGEAAFVTSEDLSGCMSNETSSASTMEAIEQNVLHAGTPSSILASRDDFAATAAAIAAEAARLAVLDYAKRMSGSSSVPFDLGDLTKLGLAFADNMQGKQVEDMLNFGAKNRVEGAQKLASGSTMRQDVAGNDKLVKVEAHVQDADGDKGNYPSIDEMGYIWDLTEGGSNHGTKQEAAEDGRNANMSGTTVVQTKKSPEAGMEIDDINPFAGRGETEFETEFETLSNSFLKKMELDDNKSVISFKEDEMSNWAGMPGHGSTKKVGTVAQEDDHLDIFFRRKTSWIPAEEPRIHEDPYSFTKVKTSFAKETLFSSHYEQKGHDVPDTSLSKPFFDGQPQKQNVSIFVEENMPSSAHDEMPGDAWEKLMSRPVFDDLPVEQNRVAGEGPESCRRPVFDEGFDDETNTYDTSLSFNDRVDNGASPGQRVGDQSPPRPVGPRTSDDEPQPCFDNFPDEPEDSSHEKTGSTPLGWNFKPSKSHQQTEETSTATEETSGSSTSDALPGGSSYPMSRRSRRKSQRVHEHEYWSDLVFAIEDGGRSSHSTSKKHTVPSTGVMQLQETEKVSKNEDSHGVRPVESLADSSDGLSEPSLRTPKWGSKGQEDGESQLNRSNFTSLSDTVSGRTKKTYYMFPHKDNEKVDYAAEGENQVASPAGPSSKVTSKFSTEEAKHKPVLQGYNEVQEGADQPEPPRPEKPNSRTDPPSRRPPSVPPQATFPPLESSISDPIILATMPPPVKKPVTPPAATPTKLETSSSAPPSTATSMTSSSIGVPDEKVPKLPQKSPTQKPPSVDDLAARFEALRRARRGE